MIEGEGGFSVNNESVISKRYTFGPESNKTVLNINPDAIVIFRGSNAEAVKGRVIDEEWSEQEVLRLGIQESGGYSEYEVMPDGSYNHHYMPIGQGQEDKGQSLDILGEAHGKFVPEVSLYERLDPNNPETFEQLTFGQTMKYFRNFELRISQVLFAKKIGLTKSTYERFENGVSLPGFKYNAEKFIDGLGLQEEDPKAVIVRDKFNDAQKKQSLKTLTSNKNKEEEKKANMAEQISHRMEKLVQVDYSNTSIPGGVFVELERTHVLVDPPIYIDVLPDKYLRLSGGHDLDEEFTGEVGPRQRRRNEIFNHVIKDRDGKSSRVILYQNGSVEVDHKATSRKREASIPAKRQPKRKG